MAKWYRVYAVWTDQSAPSGLYVLSVKGDSGSAEYCRSSSVPCVDKEAALGLQARYGDAADVASNSRVWAGPARISH
jgi:hypothetical protein